MPTKKIQLRCQQQIHKYKYQKYQPKHASLNLPNIFDDNASTTGMCHTMKSG